MESWKNPGNSLFTLTGMDHIGSTSTLNVTERYSG